HLTGLEWADHRSTRLAPTGFRSGRAPGVRRRAIGCGLASDPRQKQERLGGRTRSRDACSSSLAGVRTATPETPGSTGSESGPDLLADPRTYAVRGDDVRHRRELAGRVTHATQSGRT